MAVFGALLAATGCNHASEPEAASRSGGVISTASSSYFPLELGVTRVYEGVDAGRFRRDEVELHPHPREIMGTTCVGLVQRIFLDNALREITVEWFAPDRSGLVWKYGEETLELASNGTPTGNEWWIAGIGGGLPWPVLPAIPRAGARIAAWGASGPEEFVILATNVTANTPAGTFSGCLRLHENPDDPEDDDIILYAPGVGLVEECSNDTKIRLVQIQRN